jgi:hypothetical protein
VRSLERWWEQGHWLVSSPLPILLLLEQRAVLSARSKATEVDTG